jgi:phenylpropionate dioxygenase-like ring-hydroxylating dioxygenase large terminal subunit
MWTKVWVIAGRVSDIPNTGDYIRFDLGRESFIIVRQDSGEIAAFYNLCHHRGNQLIFQHLGNVENFRCKFHDWIWAIDGRLTDVKDLGTFEEGAMDDMPPLTPVKCDTWGGFVFINMDENSMPLLDYLGLFPDQLAGYHFEDMVPVLDAHSEWEANWKVGLDAFMEAYHVTSTHPQVAYFLDDYHIQWDLYKNGMSRMLIEVCTVSPRLPDDAPVNDYLRLMLSEVGIDPDKFNGRGRDVRRAVQVAKREITEKRGIDYSELTDDQLSDDWNYHLFPNVTLNIHAEGALVMQFLPHPKDPDKFTYGITVLARPSNDSDYRMPAYMGLPEDTDLSGKTRPERVVVPSDSPTLEPVVIQDAVAVPRVQKGMHSRAFKGLRLSKQEQRMRHYHGEIDRSVEGRK